MKNTIAIASATTLRELIDELQSMEQVANLVGSPDSGQVVYTTINSDSIKLALIEETLTDGSKVYNVEMDSVCPRGWK